jgi:hypothetical protein
VEGWVSVQTFPLTTCASPREKSLGLLLLNTDDPVPGHDLDPRRIIGQAHRTADIPPHERERQDGDEAGGGRQERRAWQEGRVRQ